MGYVAITSSIGMIVPREELGGGSGAFLPTTEKPFDGDPGNLLGSLDVNGHTYQAYNGRDGGYKYVRIYKDGTLYVTANVNTFTSDVCGFWCDISNDKATVYWVTAGSASAVAGYNFPLTPGYSPGQPYNAVVMEANIPVSVLPVVGWDETPSTDPDDPNNMDPRGGGSADIMAFGNTGDITLSDIEEPYEQEYFKLITAYALDAVDMANLGDWLFLSNFWQNLKNKFEGLSDPMQFIISCFELCVNPSYFPQTQRAFALGGDELTPPGGGTFWVNALTGRWAKVSLGSVNLKEVFGSAKDYTDVDVSIYLPFCGVKQLDPDLVVGNTLTLQVLIDGWSGDLLYLLHTSNENIGGKYYKQEAIIYRWTGNCASKIPIGKVDNTDAILRLVSGIASVGAGLAIGGAGAGVASTAAGINAAASGIQGTLGILSEGLRPTVQSSSGVGGTVGLMDINQAYLIIKRGIPQYPNDWRSTIGAPQYQTYSGTDASGYTRFSEIHLPGTVGLTDLEMAALENQLKTEGVIL